MALTSKQERFCQEYTIDFNATKAYKRAGYQMKSAKAAASEGFKLLRKPSIMRRVAELQEELKNRSELTADMVIAELRLLAFWNIQDFLEGNNEIKKLNKLSRKTTVAVLGIKTKVQSIGSVKEITTELKMHDKRGALVDLGRHLGIFEKDNEQGKTIIKVTRK